MSLLGSPRSRDVPPGALKPQWGRSGWVRGANRLWRWGCHLVPKAPGSLQFKAQSKAKPQGSARRFHHHVPQFLFLQNRDKAPPPMGGAMGPSVPWGAGMEQGCLGTGTGL